MLVFYTARARSYFVLNYERKPLAAIGRGYKHNTSTVPLCKLPPVTTLRGEVISASVGVLQDNLVLSTGLIM